MSSKNFLVEKYKKTVDDCKILYKDNFCPWEVKEGWYNILSEFSYLCEEMNIRFYKKYRYRIILEQIKQKFGTLRIYASVVQDPCRFITWIIECLNKITNKLDNIDYNFKQLNNSGLYSIYEIEVYDNENEMVYDNRAINVRTSKLKNKFVKTIEYTNYTKIKFKPTKNKIIYYIKCCICAVSKWILNFSWKFKKNKNLEEYNVIMEYMNTELDKLISKYEHESETICEECGYKINTKHETVCYTTGWITTLCESCAKKSGNEYEMGCKIFKNGIYLRDIKNG